jgi:hypothetical protein
VSDGAIPPSFLTENADGDPQEKVAGVNNYGIEGSVGLGEDDFGRFLETSKFYEAVPGNAQQFCLAINQRVGAGIYRWLRGNVEGALKRDRISFWLLLGK